MGRCVGFPEVVRLWVGYQVIARLLSVFVDIVQAICRVKT